MTFRGILSVIYVISVVPLLSVGQTGICMNISTGQPECCSDYKNVSGTCKACVGFWGRDCVRDCEFGFYGHRCLEVCNCSQNQTCSAIRGCVDTRIADIITDSCIGSFGKNCSHPCSFGFFGLNCKEKCDCTSDTHWCDNIHGCKIKDSDTLGVNNQTMGNKIKHIAFAAVGSFIGTSTFWLLLYLWCSWKRKSDTAMKVTMQEEGNSGNLGDSQRQPEVHLSGRHGRSISFQHKAKKTNGDSRKKLSRSRSLTHDTYGRFSRSDDYNHLDFLGHHNQLSASAFSSNYSKINSSDYNKIKLKISNRHDSTNSETFQGERSNMSKDTNHSLHGSEDEMTALQPHRLCKHRPYSSVKYNRKPRNPDEPVIDELTYNSTAEC